MKRLPAALALWLLAGACAVGPRYQPPSMPLPAAWQQAAAAPPAVPAAPSALERWWTAFGDQVLESLIRRATDGNLELKIATARMREARAAAGIAAAAVLPQIGVRGAYVRTQQSEAVPPFRRTAANTPLFGPREWDVFEVGFDASWELDVFGGVRRDKEAALAVAQAAEERRREVLVTMAADVARSYVDLRGAQQQLRILAETLRSQRDTLHLARERMTAGIGTELDVARANGLLEETESQRPALEQRAQLSIHRLGLLLGLEPAALAAELGAPAPIPAVPRDLPLELPSDVLWRRPDVRRAERNLAAAVARVGVARADLFPRFSILGGFGRRSDDAADLESGRSQFWSLLPSVRLPIFSGGRIRANIRVQGARQEAALREYERTVLTALEEVESALFTHIRDRQRRESLQRAAAANRRALELAMERYTAGLESFLSVLDAERSLHSVEDELVRSESNAVISLIVVYKSLGGGWS